MTFLICKLFDDIETFALLKESQVGNEFMIKLFAELKAARFGQAA
jgi:hypothetical protein